MSPHYFAELFRRSVGISPHRYVLTQRIELLRDQAQSILDAPLLTGFEDQSHDRALKAGPRA
jgi:AraC family transcriptional regulator